MTRLLLMVILILSALNSFAQEMPYDTIPYIPEYHNKRVALFRQEPRIKDRIIFLGTSITAEADWRMLLKDSTIINRGIPGDITFGVLDRLDDVITDQPSRLFIELGINDISKNIPDAIIIRNMLAIISQVQKGSPQTKIFVQSILPTNNTIKTEFPDAMNKDQHIVGVNTELARQAKKMGFTFINLFPKFQGKDGKFEPRLTVDGLHPSDAGYQLWAEILKGGKYL